MPRKNNSTPIKPSEGSTMTHEAEEWQHDMSKLQEQVQQISLSQRATKNEMDVLKKSVEAKMNGMEVGMEAKMDDMEAKIDEKMKDNMENMTNNIKVEIEGLAKLIHEILPNGEKIVEETHENKINVNRELVNSNVGGKNHHIPKMDMRKFDGKDPVTWILQMEQYFDLNNVQNTHKVCIATLHLEQNAFVWYQWLFSRKKISLGQFLWRKL